MTAPPAPATAAPSPTRCKNVPLVLVIRDGWGENPNPSHDAFNAPKIASARHSALPSQPWSPEAVQAALAQGRPVLVNFTADWCVTCKVNEGAALGSPAVAAAIQRTNAVYLVADWTRRDDRIAAELARHGRSGVPLYLLYTPGQPQPRILP